MFRGRYQHTIDPKGRLSVPAKFRDTLAQYDGALVVVPNDYCLEVHPLEEWQRIETKLREQSIFNPEVRELGRLCRLWVPREAASTSQPRQSKAAGAVC
jgi:MraZ protein